MNMLAKKAKKGFTIVELVIVIAVIAILAAVLIPTFTSVIENANESAAMQECRNEWTEYLSTIAANGDYAKDTTTYYLVYKDGTYVYEVVGGEFGESEATENTYTGESYIKIQYTYTVSNDNVTIYAPVATTDGAAEKAAADAAAAAAAEAAANVTTNNLLTAYQSSYTVYAVVVANSTTYYFTMTYSSSTWSAEACSTTPTLPSDYTSTDSTTTEGYSVTFYYESTN